MMNEIRIFKIVGISPRTNRQEKKRIYTSEKDYLRYKDDIITRYKNYLHVKCYESIKGNWELIYERKCIKPVS